MIDEVSGEVTVTDDAPDEATKRLLHKTIDALRTDFDGLRFNTAIARLIELNNALTKLPAVPREVAEALVVMTAPVAPHIAEELWAKLGHPESLTFEDFPKADPALLVDATVTCVVQVQGKVRDRLEVAADIGDEDLQAQALARDKIISSLAGKVVRKVIVRARTWSTSSPPDKPRERAGPDPPNLGTCGSGPAKPRTCGSDPPNLGTVRVRIERRKAMRTDTIPRFAVAG